VVVDLFWGFWNGLTAWIIHIVHVFGGWVQFPFYNEARSGNWYDFGFLLGAGSPVLGLCAGAREGAPRPRGISCTEGVVIAASAHIEGQWASPYSCNTICIDTRLF
jgi:hypothetical protein